MGAWWECLQRVHGSSKSIIDFGPLLCTCQFLIISTAVSSACHTSAFIRGFSLKISIGPDSTVMVGKSVSKESKSSTTAAAQQVIFPSYYLRKDMLECISMIVSIATMRFKNCVRSYAGTKLQCLDARIPTEKP